MTDWRSWREAMTSALYGPAGFFLRSAPAAHFRTSVHVSPDLFASAVRTLARSHNLTAVVDIGAGRGELLNALLRLDPSLSLAGVEVAARPDSLPDSILWSATYPSSFGPELVIANEWLDNIPVDVASVDASGVVRLVEVDEDGTERLGAPVSGRDAAWLSQWWPLTAVGARAEIGWPRDDAWDFLVRQTAAGSALVAIDYGYLSKARPMSGSLTGYRSGIQVAPIPDGSCDLTAHVLWESVRSAGELAGATTLTCCTQAESLASLGISASRPPLSLARSDPAGYLRALSATGEASELLDPEGLGGFTWLTQRV